MRAEDPDISEDVARFFLSLDFPESDRRRMSELAAKAQSGGLDPVEQAEIEDYRNLGHLLALLQLKARKVLKNGDPSA
jgi:hypothetical protein